MQVGVWLAYRAVLSAPPPGPDTQQAQKWLIPMPYAQTVGLTLNKPGLMSGGTWDAYFGICVLGGGVRVGVGRPDQQ